MKKVIVNSGLSSGLRTEFNLVHSIEIEDKPFAVGGFGEVYHCISINGIPAVKKLVVKIFKDNLKGSEEHSFKTTQRLQKKVNNENQMLLAQKNQDIIGVYPAFSGLPQYSFKGVINGNQISGFMADNLISLGFTEFQHFLQNPSYLAQYQNFPIERKMQIAYQLVSAFKVLEDFRFIHADLKPEALFINLALGQIAIIDFDSGVITENPDDEPSTWGAANDWVAPEIWEQQTNIQRGDKIKVDVYSDRWSVAVGIHYLMTTFHPLFYLTELSPRVAKQYFTPQNQWPNINKSAPYFQKANEAIYDQYLPWLNLAIPQLVREKLAHTMNFGYKNPVARTSYSDWKSALLAIQQPPKILFFKTDKNAIIDSLDVELSWEVENAHTIEIDPNLGQLQSKGSLKTKPAKNQKFKLRAIGYYGQTDSELEVKVFPIPIIESLIIPTPEIQQYYSIDRLNFQGFKLDLSINIETNNISQTSERIIQENPKIHRISQIVDQIKHIL